MSDKGNILQSTPKTTDQINWFSGVPMPLINIHQYIYKQSCSGISNTSRLFT